ncbi:MAG: type II toxin-antitoxin system RelE/ParE family toxin [Planctomycetota bacterium]
MIRVVFYKEDDGTVPVQDFLAGCAPKARIKIIARIKRLRQLGHQLRRPEADYLGESIYELRTRLGHVNYRVLFFFHGNVAAVLASGCTGSPGFVEAINST